MKRRPILLLVILAGCTTTTEPVPVEYLLRPPLEETVSTTQQPPVAVLGRLTVAPYLDREGIVVETGDQSIQAARNHRWAEPLSHSVRRMLQVGISQAAAAASLSREDSPDYEAVVDVHIHQLHGSLAGKVVLAAEWEVRRPRTRRVLGRHELVRSTLTGADGYDALVRAHGELLGQLATAIAATLPDSPAP